MKSEMINVIMMIINLPAVYILCLAGAGRSGKGLEEGGCSYRKTFVWKSAWLLEFAVYGAGMTHLTDLIIQGIAGPGNSSRALFAVRIILAESMLLLFPLWKILYSDCRRGRNDSEQNCEICRNGKDMEPAVCGGGLGTRLKPECILSMFLLLGMTLQTWREREPVRAFWLQTGYLMLFAVFEYLNERQGRREGPGSGGIHCYAGGKYVSESRHEHEITNYRCGQEAAMEGLQHRRQEEYLKNVEQQYQRTRELWHDLKNHIKILEILAGEERFEELTDYLDSFQRDVERRMIPTKTGCAVVDALLGDKLYQAGKQGTKMSLQLCNLSEMRLQAVDLCVILGNLLDNAIEACARIPEEGCIRLRLRQEEGFYYLRVVNTAGEPVKKGQGYISGKRNRDNGVGHGLGLRSAERLAHQYGGSLITDYSDGEFTVVVRLRALQ